MNMKATGIVRRIDELGRVVIPKEIRRTLRIREGDPLEIYTDREGGVILKKYSPIGELMEFAREFADSLYKTLGYTAVICDKDLIIAASGLAKKDYMDSPVSPQLETVMEERRTLVFNAGEGGNAVAIVNGEDTTQIFSEVVAPIISEGQPIGAVAIISRKKDDKMGQTELKVAETTANFLGVQMEQ
jgi:AbrB family transcriptional regulator (stage V sporulation protein T)